MTKVANYLVIICTILIASCKSKESETEKVLRESQEFLNKIEVDRRVDSMMKQTARNVYFDTVGVGAGPVKVISAKLTKKEYSNYRDIEVTFMNVSGKRIEGIRFKWYGENAFGEPADMGGVNLMTGSEGFGGGFTDEPLNPGKTQTSEWSINSKDGRKVVKAWPYEVVFSDGSKWKSLSN